MLYKMQDFTGNVSQSATIYEGHPISNENKQYDLVMYVDTSFILTSYHM